MTGIFKNNKEIWFDISIIFIEKTSEQYTIGSFKIQDEKLNNDISPKSICKYIYENLNEFIDVDQISSYIEGDLTIAYHELFGNIIKIPTISFIIKPNTPSGYNTSVQLIINNIHRI